MSRAAWVLGLTAAAGAIAFGQPGSVVNGPHNLAAGGPSPIQASIEDQVCIFCHTPHSARPIRPLWNRYTPIDAYRVYTSRSLDAEIGQPTGASKMCLSCHDGTIALGNVVSRDTPISMSGGLDALPPGASNLGADLSDDHPISFRYDGSLAAGDPHLKDPSLLPPDIQLDANLELQCTSCHDAHDNINGMFLVRSNEGSGLCLSCHQMGTTTITEHTECNACHQPHTAPSGPFLLRQPTVTETCLSCHDGSDITAPDIATDLQKIYTHDSGAAVNNPVFDPSETTCTDCHEPHSMQQGSAPAPGVHPNFGQVSGVNASGASIASANHEYEVCFKCHGDNNPIQPTVSRHLVMNNTRLEFAQGSISAHAVIAARNVSDVPSLLPGWTTASVMACSDCHASDTGTHSGGTGADGVHGSNSEPMLIDRYETMDFTSESAQAYALCYRCHERANILADQSFGEHEKHIIDERTPCAACHDSHGVSNLQGTFSGNTNLINFASSIVFPDEVTGRLEFRDTGRFSGECFLSCHGENHSGLSYEP